MHRNYMEIGSEFKKILADYEGQVEFDESKMPVFDADNDDFTLTLYNLNYGTNYAIQVNENVIEILEEKIKKLMPEYSKKKLAKACEILKMISENPNISIDELRIALDVTDRTIATLKGLGGSISNALRSSSKSSQIGTCFL